MLEEVVVSWQEVRWIWWMRQNFIAQFIRLLKHWLCNVWLGIVVEKSLAHFVDQYQRKALKLSVHLIDLLSILLRCNGFTRIQRAVVDQTSSRPPNSDMTFFWCKFGFGKCFRASSQSNHWAGHCCLLYKIYFSSHVTIYSRNSREDTSKWLFFFFFCNQFMRYAFNELFLLSNLFQMPNDYTVVDIEFFGNFSHSCKRTSFRDDSRLVLSTSNGQPATSASRFLSSFQNFLNHHCHVGLSAVHGPNALSMFWVVSAALQPILNSNKKITQICFFV